MRLLAAAENDPTFRKTFKLSEPEGLQNALSFVKRRFGDKLFPPDKLSFYREMITAQHRSELFDIALANTEAFKPTPLKELISDLVNLHCGAKGIALFCRTDEDLCIENALCGKLFRFRFVVKNILFVCLFLVCLVCLVCLIIYFSHALHDDDERRYYQAYSQAQESRDAC
jgi:hypothetical protein